MFHVNFEQINMILSNIFNKYKRFGNLLLDLLIPFPILQILSNNILQIQQHTLPLIQLILLIRPMMLYNIPRILPQLLRIYKLLMRLTNPKHTIIRNIIKNIQSNLLFRRIVLHPPPFIHINIQPRMNLKLKILLYDTLI